MAYSLLDCQLNSAHPQLFFRFLLPKALDPAPPCSRSLCLPRCPLFLQADKVKAKLLSLRQHALDISIHVLPLYSEGEQTVGRYHHKSLFLPRADAWSDPSVFFAFPPEFTF